MSYFSFFVNQASPAMTKAASKIVMASLLELRLACFEQR